MIDKTVLAIGEQVARSNGTLIRYLERVNMSRVHGRPHSCPLRRQDVLLVTFHQVTQKPLSQEDIELCR